MATEKLAALTGLKPGVAERCVNENCGRFEMALASIVQSAPLLGDDSFVDRAALQANAAKINADLEVIYGAVHALMKATGMEEDQAWLSIHRGSEDRWCAAEGFKYFTGDDNVPAELLAATKFTVADLAALRAESDGMQPKAKEKTNPFGAAPKKDAANPFGAKAPAEAPKKDAANPFGAKAPAEAPKKDAAKAPAQSQPAEASMPANDPQGAQPELIWRCVKCNKPKDLRGKHLDGKTEVRSDCWPCAKKTTFRAAQRKPGETIGPAQGGGDSVPAAPAAEPAKEPTKAPAAAEPAKSAFGAPAAAGAFKSAFGAKTAAPAGDAAKAPAAEPAKSAFGAPAAGGAFKSAFGAKTAAPAGDAAKALAAAGAFKSAFGQKAAAPAGDAAKAPAAAGAFKSAFGQKTTAPEGDAAKAPAAAGAFKSAFGQKTAAPAGDAAKAPSAADAKPPTSAPAKASFGFGFGQAQSTAAPASGAAKAPSAFAANFGKSAPKPADEKPKMDVSKLPLLPESRYTGPLWDMPNFEEKEIVARCTLLNKDGGFLQSIGKENLRARLKKWVAKCPMYLAPPRYVTWTDPDEDIVRVIIKDSVRTFFGDEHRDKFSEFLFAARMEFGDYGQAMSYIAGLCMLVLDERETMAVLRKLAKEYIPGHWAAEAAGFATSAYVIFGVMRKKMPDVAKHFDKLNFWPETYMQKIISGLGVHVLPFNLLFDFLDAFMEQGFNWLVRYELAIVEHFREELLKCEAEDMGTLFEIMRLDARAAEPNDMAQIHQRALRMDLGDLLDNLDVDRMTVYNEKVLPKLNAAPKEEAFEPCDVCDEKRPKWWCNTCEAKLCNDCNASVKGEHNKATCDVETY